MEVNTSFFEDMQSSFLVQSRRIQMAASRLGNRRFVEENVPVMLEQLPVLMSVYSFNNITQQKIADLIHRDKSSIQRTLTSLKKLGLIEISASATDKRANVVCLTSKGWQMTEKIINIKQELDAVVMENISEQEGAALTAKLREIADRIEHL